VKRVVVLLAGLTMMPLVGFAPSAHALGLAACTIGGTISFSPPPGGSGQGTWRIEPGAINCEGFYKSTDRFLGQGPFTGSGSYTLLPSGAGDCLYQVGTGTVDYVIRTTAGTYSLTEQNQFVVAGAGKFSTPSLEGSFVRPPDDGDCVSKPVTRATFVAEALLTRDDPAGVTPHGNHRDLPRNEG
jgi:hypothetical protein